MPVPEKINNIITPRNYTPETYTEWYKKSNSKCECGCIVKTNYMYKHRQTKKHIHKIIACGAISPL